MGQPLFAMSTLDDREVRDALGLSARVTARLAGVDRRTLAMYELAPHRVRVASRARCQRLYESYRTLLREAPGLRLRS